MWGGELRSNIHFNHFKASPPPQLPLPPPPPPQLPRPLYRCLGTWYWLLLQQGRPAEDQDTKRLWFGALHWSQVIYRFCNGCNKFGDASICLNINVSRILKIWGIPLLSFESWWIFHNGEHTRTYACTHARTYACTHTRTHARTHTHTMLQIWLTHQRPKL